MALVYLIQHAQKTASVGDPGLTAVGGRQAALAAARLVDAGIGALFSSPMRRARDTAAPLAAVTGLPVRVDERLRERMNWDDRQTVDEFLGEWVRASADRDFAPLAGDSSRVAGARMRQFLTDVAELPYPVAAVGHGGATVDLLRSLLGDGAVAPELVDNGVPPAAITRFDGLRVISVADTDHLAAL